MRYRARARTAAALRRLAHTLHAHDAEPELLDRIARASAAVTDEIAASPPRVRDSVAASRRMWSDAVADGARVDHFEDCFVSGRWNPLGIGVHARREGSEVHAHVTLGAAFEGAPGRAHGGIVAAVFDDVLGCLLRLERTPAYTGELRVRYHAPAPVGGPLLVRARVVDRDGRKLDTEAEAVVEVEGGPDVTVATATARFIAITDDAG